MSPRTYRLGQRQVATDQVRARIIEATHALLRVPRGLNGFSIKTDYTLFTLTGFEFFDGLAGPDRRADEVAPTVYRLALAALGMAGTA